MVCIPCRLYDAGYEACRECGGEVVTPPRKWSPPQRKNKRAWKRIEKGEWLWDRRRVRRNPRYQPPTFHRMPTHKKGQGVWGQWAVPRKKGADVDMGG